LGVAGPLFRSFTTEAQLQRPRGLNTRRGTEASETSDRHKLYPPGRALWRPLYFFVLSPFANSGTSIFKTNVSAGPVGITFSVMSQIPCMRFCESLSTNNS